MIPPSDPNPFPNPEQQAKFDEVMAEIAPDLERIQKELEDCQRLTEADLTLVINAR